MNGFFLAAFGFDGVGTGTGAGDDTCVPFVVIVEGIRL